MNPLKTNGLVIQNFPQEKYESIYYVLSSKYAERKEYEHFSGAWNAMSYRYKATTDHGKYFIKLLKEDGATPPPEKRYLQEMALFDHFSSCFSVFESTCYGVYAIGSIVDPKFFPLETQMDQQKVSPKSTQKAFENAFPGDPVISAFERLFADAEFQKWREIRNILTHRTAPGRKVYISIGGEDTPPTEWKLNNIPLDASIMELTENGMRRNLTNLLEALEIFCKTKL